MNWKTGNPSGSMVHWMVVFAYATMIFLLSSKTLIRTPSFYYKNHLDKVIHFIEFGIFAVLLCRAVRRTVWATPLKVMLIAVCIATGYAISDEIHQRVVRGRSSDWKDVAADVVGAGAGVCFWRVFTATLRESREECSAR